MNSGCLSFIILFPAGIFIWVAGENRRRASLPPDELKKLQAEEDYGSINEKLECIFCHSKNCVRTRPNALLEDGADANSPKGIYILMTSSTRSGPPSKEKYVAAHCMKCGSYWDMFPPDQ